MSSSSEESEYSSDQEPHCSCGNPCCSYTKTKGGKRTVYYRNTCSGCRNAERRGKRKALRTKTAPKSNAPRKCLRARCDNHASGTSALCAVHGRAQKNTDERRLLRRRKKLLTAVMEDAGISTSKKNRASKHIKAIDRQLKKLRPVRVAAAPAEESTREELGSDRERAIELTMGQRPNPELVKDGGPVKWKSGERVVRAVCKFCSVSRTLFKKTGARVYFCITKYKHTEFCSSPASFAKRPYPWHKAQTEAITRKLQKNPSISVAQLHEKLQAKHPAMFSSVTWRQLETKAFALRAKLDLPIARRAQLLPKLRELQDFADTCQRSVAALGPNPQPTAPLQINPAPLLLGDDDLQDAGLEPSKCPVLDNGRPYAFAFAFTCVRRLRLIDSVAQVNLAVLIALPSPPPSRARTLFLSCCLCLSSVSFSPVRVCCVFDRLAAYDLTRFLARVYLQ